MNENRLPANSISGNSAEEFLTAQQNFWQILATIPPGRVTSYGRLAQLAGLGRGARLVARWLAQLPEGSSLPWHRVVNSRGQLSLSPCSPAGVEQRHRLQSEGVPIINHRVNMARFGWPESPEQPQDLHE
ncbi:MGMT family protein [Pseudomonas sp. OIL-1]|uniref:MGMT family protein n=1 Tax=Pseudomonas sp. OIL-1 TaxID=2706126 RepID=UPI0013A78F6C|nr:MGMT family protein [Pseudomonas sp. OIL-1]QIB51249.1 DNA base-flipping protein YbaZ [Pseudomonas sp. OIL-1]